MYIVSRNFIIIANKHNFVSGYAVVQIHFTAIFHSSGLARLSARPQSGDPVKSYFRSSGALFQCKLPVT